jgi:Uma2 family endonuclease
VTASAREVGVYYTVPRVRPGWELSEETMPESTLHDDVCQLLKLILTWWAWAQRAGAARVVRNLAVRWDPEHPRNGVDPDVCVLSPAPPGDPDLRSLLTWTPGAPSPLLAIEVVSETNPHKDYVAAPDKYAACGVTELWIFDPVLAGPDVRGGPHRLQVWRREDGSFVRVYAGEGPFRSPVLDAHLVVVEGGRKLRIASDAEGSQLWPTAEEAERAAKEAERAAKEAERAAKEAERAAKEAERAAKEAALSRIAELEAELARRRG